MNINNMANRDIYYKPKIILFDWDNTLVDTKNLFSSVLAITLERLNMSQDFFQKHEFKSTRNMSVRDSFPIMFGDNWQYVWNKYKECYSETLNERGGIAIMDGAKKFLTKLHNDSIKLGVVSNKHHDLLINEVKKLGLVHFFESIVGSSKSYADKPSAAHALYAVNEIQDNVHITIHNIADECWLVGDSYVDVSCAINTGCLPVLFGSPSGHILSRQYVMARNIKYIEAESFHILKGIYTAMDNK